MKFGFTDIHTHLLYGLDDGPNKPQDMYRMLDKAAKQGINEIVVTPHVTPGRCFFDTAQYQKAMQEAKIYCKEQKLDIRLYGGAEILYSDQTCRMLADGKIPTMAGTNCVLVEFLPDVQFDRMHQALNQLMETGYCPILAHAERYTCLALWPPRVLRLKQDMPVYIQVNASTIIEKKGLLKQVFVKWMLNRQLVDAVASDAHGTTARPNRLRAAWKILKEEYGYRYACKLVSGKMLKE